MAKKKKEVKKEKKYASKVEERVKKIKSIESTEDTSYWKDNEKTIEKYMKFGRVKHKDKQPKKISNRFK